MTATNTISAPIQFFSSGLLVALVGNPNCGKTALFNRLTGSQQKVANYAGVTVERKEGKLIGSQTANKKSVIRVLDLPGTFSLYARSPDEQVTVDVLHGRAKGERKPDLVVCVVNASNLRRHLRLVLSVQRLGIRCVVAVNMMDIAQQRGLQIDCNALSNQLGLPVVETIAIESGGHKALVSLIEDASQWSTKTNPQVQSSMTAVADLSTNKAQNKQTFTDQQTISQILANIGLNHAHADDRSDRLDNILLHPIAGPIILFTLLFLIFQAVFAWAVTPMDLIKLLTMQCGDWVTSLLPAGWIQSLLVNGVIAGVGGVIVFLPQILILFFFILLLEESGYLPRAAYLLDRMMASVGLSGRSFIPLLSSFACAVPGIMAARTISNQRDRWLTIMIAPLMTCSARLPVYALLIGAFIPQRTLAGVVQLQGIVLFALYIAGIVSAMGIAWILKTFTHAGKLPRPLMMELPAYHLPRLRSVVMGLWQRTQIFLSRVGTIILGLTLILWFLSSYPEAPAGATGAAIEYSFAGTLGRLLAIVFEPIGFNWQICIALVPGMAAREVAVGALGTVYALSGNAAQTAEALTPMIAKTWSLATAFSLLAWYVFAPQCLSTLAAVKRETGGWRAPLIMASYLFGLAYLASFITYRTAIYFGLN